MRLFAVSLILFIALVPSAHGIMLVEEFKITPSDGAEHDNFGRAVALDGDTALVGAPGSVSGDPRPGAVYVFRFDGFTWVEEARLTASDGADGDYFGGTVALDGDVAMVGASGYDNGAVSGAVYVYRFNGSGWVEEAKLVEGGSTVALNGPVAAVEMDQLVRLFRHNGSAWAHEADLSPDPDDYRFGYGISLTSDGVLVGAVRDTGYQPRWYGVAHLYRYDGSWNLDTTLETELRWYETGFELKVAFDGTTALVGGPLHGWNDGAVHYFRDTGSGWQDEGKVESLYPSSSSRYGASVAVDGALSLIGAPRELVDPHANAGQVWVGARPDQHWLTRDRLIASDAAYRDYFGSEVALDGTMALVGVPLDDDLGSSSGSAYIFDLSVLPPAKTLEVSFTCDPLSGTLPFGTMLSVKMTNYYHARARQLDARINLSLANGQQVSNWKGGYTNVYPGNTFWQWWTQTIPAVGPVVGVNTFTLVATDVTPAPYNQPPYPPAGDIDTGICLIEGIAP